MASTNPEEDVEEIFRAVDGNDNGTIDYTGYISLNLIKAN